MCNKISRLEAEDGETKIQKLISGLDLFLTYCMYLYVPHGQSRWHSPQKVG